MMNSISPGVKRGLRFGLRLGVSLAFAWLVVLVVLAWQYTYTVLHPRCPSTPEVQPGYVSVILTTSDGIPLRGWWAKGTNGAAILLLPGHGGGRDSQLVEAKMMQDAGYGVLLAEPRGCTGAQATLGYAEVKDFAAMLQYVEQQPGVSWIGVMGFSAGGVTAIRGAVDAAQVKALVAAGTFADLGHEMTDSKAPVLSLEWQIRQMVQLAYWVQVGVPPGAVAPIRDLPRLTPRPVLLIHGSLEAVHTQAQAQQAALGENGQSWLVEGAGHGEYYRVAGGEYQRRILEFFKQASGR